MSEDYTASRRPVSDAKAKAVLRVLGGEMLQPPPLWLMRQAGRYLPEYREIRDRVKDFLELCYTPDLAVELTLQPVRRFGLDAAILFADILLVPDALGQRVQYREGEGPLLEPIRSADDLRRLEKECSQERLAPVYEALGRVAREVPAGVTVIGFAGAPWTVAAYMVEGGSSRDFGHARTWAHRDPNGFQKLIDLLVEAITDHLVAQAGAGAEIVQIFDSLAGLLPEEAFGRWCAGPVAEIVRRFRKAHPMVPVIAFPRGAGPLYAGYVKRTGVDGLSIDTGLPASWAARKLQGRCVVQGNLDPMVLVAGGRALEREARRILDILGHGRFIFNLGHGVVPATPPEHVAELVAIVRDWRP